MSIALHIRLQASAILSAHSPEADAGRQAHLASLQSITCPKYASGRGNRAGVVSCASPLRYFATAAESFLISSPASQQQQQALGRHIKSSNAPQTADGFSLTTPSRIPSCPLVASLTRSILSFHCPYVRRSYTAESSIFN
ncbi:hypothetical protein GQ54DRAFT_57479 [Martensiomyces pterosporus]|nr:hypothetical protein GQ54DRAFT_57479 [Martensiomyces pterosporus]